ncbi:MAG: GNAT family protein [Chloroflexota bacterium]|nr:GNAT family protein [Chloroflexota bacterium]
MRVFDFNHRALRCYQKYGFHQEGRLREAHFTEGHYHDVLLMDILASEFGLSPVPNQVRAEERSEGGGK